jgi:hypothetical protein
VILKQIGNTYHLGCPGCGKKTAILSDLPRAFDAKRDDIAYCDNRKTCPLPKRPMIANVNRSELRVAQFCLDSAQIAARGNKKAANLDSIRIRW